MFLLCRFAHAPDVFFFFFFHDPATTELYTLSLHDALPIWPLDRLGRLCRRHRRSRSPAGGGGCHAQGPGFDDRSEEHTSELQSRENLVCRLLLEKKKKRIRSALRADKRGCCRSPSSGK